MEIKTHKNKKHNVNESFFDEIDANNKAYFLGLMMSDGTVSDRAMVISLQERDSDILVKFKKNIEFTGNISYYPSKKENHQSTTVLRIYSKNLVKSLNNLGCIRRKTYNLNFPKINQRFYSHFIRGFFDGDGCIISKGNGHYFSVTGNIEFLKQLNEILSKEMSINPFTISRKNKSNNVFGAIQCTNNSYLIKLRDYLYEDCEDLYLKRKYDKFFELVEKIDRVCKVCGKNHHSRDYCKTCYSREYSYKRLKIEKSIVCIDLKTNKKEKFKNIKLAIDKTGLKYHSIWNNLNGRSKTAGNFQFSYG
jgi:hypothetical protein